MPTKKELIDELNFLSELLSDRTRWVSVGVLAFGWAVVVQSHEAKNGAVPFLAVGAIIGPIALASLALLIDFCQYCFGYALNLQMLKGLPKNQDSVSYDNQALLYRLRLLAFYAKITLALSAASWFIIVLAIRLVQMLPGGEL